jgi:hypothetical protein
MRRRQPRQTTNKPKSWRSTRSPLNPRLRLHRNCSINATGPFVLAAVPSGRRDGLAWLGDLKAAGFLVHSFAHHPALALQAAHHRRHHRRNADTARHHRPPARRQLSIGPQLSWPLKFRKLKPSLAATRLHAQENSTFCGWAPLIWLPPDWQRATLEVAPHWNQAQEGFACPFLLALGGAAGFDCKVSSLACSGAAFCR